MALKITRGRIAVPNHAEHGEPHVGERLGREPAVSDAQHVGHRLHR